jgi:hypothetical protein
MYADSLSEKLLLLFWLSSRVFQMEVASFLYHMFISTVYAVGMGICVTIGAVQFCPVLKILVWVQLWVSANQFVVSVQFTLPHHLQCLLYTYEVILFREWLCSTDIKKVENEMS